MLVLNVGPYEICFIFSKICFSVLIFLDSIFEIIKLTQFNSNLLKV